MKSLVLAILLSVAPIGVLGAQAIRGRLVEEVTDVPVVGALLLLQDSAGKRVAQGVSGSEGRFSIKAPAPGAYTLRVLRIGYLPVESMVRLSEGETLTRTMALAGAPVALPEITVAGTATCGDRARKDTLSAALWTQAGTALAITAQTVKSQAYRFQTVLEDRDLDRFGTPSTPRQVNELSISTWPVRSPSPDTLLTSGFVENIEDLVVGPTWYGPDAEFLLSDPFFEGHCFWTVPPGLGDPSEWVGLAFEPGAKDQRSDIRGTLWLDQASAELRRLDFSYTRLPKWAREVEAGGTLRFAPLPGGGWIVQRWMLRVPVPQLDVGSGKVTVLGFRESGGRVTAVLNSRGKVVQDYDR
jgi:hypothetical protein